MNLDQIMSEWAEAAHDAQGCLLVFFLLTCVWSGVVVLISRYRVFKSRRERFRHHAFSTLTRIGCSQWPRAELERRLKAERERPRATGAKRGPKPKASRPTAS